MTKEELLEQMTIEQAEQFAEHTGYIFGPEELVCVVKNTDQVELEDITSVEELFDYLAAGYSAVPF